MLIKSKFILFVLCGMTQCWATEADRNAYGNDERENILLAVNFPPSGPSSLQIPFWVTEVRKSFQNAIVKHRRVTA